MKPFRQNTPIDTSLHINELDSVQQFAEDVRAGLGKTPKSLPCIYFYDETGSKIFEQICRQPEYYCTRAEGEILQTHACDIAAHCCDPVQIVELGSGSSAKTRILLEAFVEAKIQTAAITIPLIEGPRMGSGLHGLQRQRNRSTDSNRRIRPRP